MIGGQLNVLFQILKFVPFSPDPAPKIPLAISPATHGCDQLKVFCEESIGRKATLVEAVGNGIHHKSEADDADPVHKP